MARGRRKKCHVPWPDLPLHLLELVSSRLCLIDYLNFRRVCSTWRAAAKQHNPSLDYPLLMTPGRRVGRRVDDECRFFIKASDGKRCVMLLPEFGKRYAYVGCFYGWLLIGDVYLRHLLFLMNPFTGARIDLPLWDVTKSVYRATLSSPPTEPNCVVIILNYWYSNITFCRIGDNAWTTQECHLEKPEEALLFRGKFYILCHQLRLPDAECSSQPKLAMMKLPQGPHHSFTLWKCVPYLVESGDEILLVVKGYSRPNGPVDRFIVLQLDLSTSSWLVLESLRDHILFLGENCSVSLQAARLGRRGNLIYFTEPHHSGWWVFDMENGSIVSISRRSGCHKYTNENPPVWITPHFV
ncbi:hypothetical protein AAC387_Pa03g2687 [Persea americana]